MNYQVLFVLACSLLLNISAFSQSEEYYAKKDSIKEQRQIARAEKYAYLNPSTAAYLSMILPGAGQVYNRSYWKVPLVYGGLASFATIAVYNHNEYIKYKNAYNDKRDDDPETKVPDDLRRLSENALRANRNATKKYRDLNIIIGILFYGLNVADAYVDAHLKSFEVGDDISMDIDPAIFMNGNSIAGGLTLNIRLK
jgi:hypothetical protein